MAGSASEALSFIPLIALLALVAAVALVAWRRRASGARAVIGSIAWTVPAALALAAVGIMGVMGLLGETCGAATVTGFAAAELALGAATLLRAPLAQRIDGLNPVPATTVRVLRDVAALAIAALLSLLALEIPWNDNLPYIFPTSFALGYAIVLAALAAAYFLGQRTGGVAVLVSLTCLGFGIAQHFVLVFKSAAILPSDLLAIGTAAAVGGGYVFTLTKEILIAVVVATAAILALSLMRPAPAREGRRALRACANTATSLVLVALMVLAYGSISMKDDLGFVYDSWMPITTYRQNGFLPSFIAVAQDLPIPEPDGYSQEEAQQSLNALAAAYDQGMGATPERQAAVEQFQQVQPTVIAIMNESFSDLSIYEGLRDAGYTGPAYYNGLADTLQRGTLLSSVFGGGTADTEFEFLTGASLAFIGAGKYPYQLYDLSEVESLPKQLSSLGYTTRAVHAQDPNNWNRTMVYSQLGFDEFHSGDEFTEAPVYHAGATDLSTYDYVLDLLEQDSAPQFIFNITIQNHGGYTAESIPEGDATAFDIPGMDQTATDELNVYLGLIQKSDADLAYLIERLRTIGRPVVLIFFGDHQPTASWSLNEALYPGEDAMDHQWRLYESTYFIWANYEVAGAPADGWLSARELGASQLAAYALNIIGAPLSDYQKAQLVASQEVTSLNIIGYRGANGLRYALDGESPYAAFVDQMRRIQYLTFASRVQ